MDNQKLPGQSDEVDLERLFSKIGDFFESIWLGLMRLLARLRRIPIENRPSFILIISASAIIGFSYSYFLKKDYFESTMILSSNYLNKRLVENTIEKLNLLSQERNKSGLAQALRLSDSTAGKLVGFEAKPFVAETDLIELEVLKEQLKNAQSKNPKVIDQVVQRIEIENRHAFEITVRTTDPLVIEVLQESIVNYFKSNDYIKKRIEINKLNLIAKKEKLLAQSQKLDSLKSVIYSNYKSMAEQSRQGSNNVILSDQAVTDPIEVYAQDLNIYQQIEDINRALYIQPDFEVVDDFVKFSEPASTSLFGMLVYSFLVGIVIAYLDVSIRQFNKYLANLN